VLVQNTCVVSEVRLENIQAAIQIEIADAYSHSSLLHAVFIQRHAALQANLGEGAIPVVQEQKARRRIASDVDVRPAIVVKVGRDHGHRITALCLCHPRYRGNVGERAITIVPVHADGTWRQSSRTAIYGDALPVAVNRPTRLRYGFEIELQVGGHAQIEQPIAIVIDERAAGSPADAWMNQAGLFGDVCKGSVAIVPV